MITREGEVGFKKTKQHSHQDAGWELYKAECQCIKNGVTEAWRHGTLGPARLRAEILDHYFFIFD